jgi:hypothetical protein
MRWPFRRFGRRDAFLGLFGIIWLILGYGWSTQPLTPQARQGLAPLLSVAPIDVWALLWLGGGIVAILAAGTSPLRPHYPQRQAAGYAALIFPVLVWTAGYLVSWLSGFYARGWLAATVWLVVSLAVLIVAGWPETPEPIPNGSEK